MAIVVTAALLTTPPPVPVQLSITGLTIGTPVVVTGATGSWTWPVPGGTVTPTATSLILVDNRAPINSPITYTVSSGGSVVSSGSVTVPFTGYKTVLTSFDGDIFVPVAVSKIDAREMSTRTNVTSVAGRRNPPTRYDVLNTETGTLSIAAPDSTTAILKLLLAPGRPIVRRSTAGFMGAPPSELLQVTGKVSHGLYAVGDTWREWSFPYVVIDDPEPSVTAIVFDWDDFDTIYAAQTWANFDTAWAASTWDDFDRFDWGQLL